MYFGGYMVSWWEEPPHERPWVVHDTNVEDGDEILMEGFTNLACGNTPLYATANRFYFKVGSGSPKPAQEVFAFMRRIEGIQKGSVPVPSVSIIPTWESLQLFRTKRKSWNWPMMTSALGLALLDQRISVDVNVSTEMSGRLVRAAARDCLLRRLWNNNSGGREASQVGGSWWWIIGHL